MVFVCSFVEQSIVRGLKGRGKPFSGEQVSYLKNPIKASSEIHRGNWKSTFGAFFLIMDLVDRMVVRESKICRQAIIYQLLANKGLL
jgi:hypothetical protein